ncbi:hypothetical protein [Actinomadura kijaniata]|nr:hypothetical protein [Actinomadura kijaniata]
MSVGYVPENELAVSPLCSQLALPLGDVSLPTCPTGTGRRRC